MSGLDEIQETYNALTQLLDDEESFGKVVKAVFNVIDKDNSGTIELNEIEDFIENVCKEMGINKNPDKNSIKEVFKELDEDHSNSIDEKELAKFLKILFGDQRAQCEATLKENGRL